LMKTTAMAVHLHFLEAAFSCLHTNNKNCFRIRKKLSVENVVLIRYRGGARLSGGGTVIVLGLSCLKKADSLSCDVRELYKEFTCLRNR
jgi:hypothetical protein